MSETTITANAGKFSKNIHKINGDKLQLKGKNQSSKFKNFIDSLNEVSKHNLENDDNTSTDRSSKSLLSSQTTKAEKGINKVIKKDIEENDSQDNSNDEQLLVSILQQLKNITGSDVDIKNLSASQREEFWDNQAINSVTSESQQAFNNKDKLSDTIDKLLEKQDKNSTKPNDINAVLDKINYLLSGKVNKAEKVDIKTDLRSVDENISMKDSVSLYEPYSESVNALEVDKSPIKVDSLVQQNSNNQDKLPTITEKQAVKEKSIIKEILLKLQSFESSNNINGNSIVANSSLENSITPKNNNADTQDNEILSKLNLQNISYVDNSSQSKVSVVSAKDELINNINGELQKLLSTQNENGNITLEKQGKNSIKLNDISAVLDRINYLLSYKVNKAEKLDIKTDLKSVDENTLIQNKELLHEFYPRSVNALGVDKYSFKAASVVRQHSNNQDKLANIAGTQSSKEISILKEILSELQSFVSSNDISSNSIPSNSSLVDSITLKNNNADLQQNLILSKLNLQNISEVYNNSQSKVIDVSVKDKLINNIKQDLQNLLFMQNGNRNTALEKQNRSKLNDINTLINRINYLLADKVDTKAGLNEENKLSSNNVISTLNNILLELKDLKSSNLVSNNTSISANNKISSDRNSLFYDMKALDNNQKQSLNKREITNLQNILSKLQDMHHDTNIDSSKLIAISDSQAKNKDNEFLNKLVDNKDSEDKYSRVVNIMNQFTVNNVNVNNQKQDIQLQVVRSDNFSSDFIKGLNYMEDNNIKNMTVKIVPKDLGEMFIKITSDGSIMKATITATNRDSYNLLNSNLHEITNSLNNQHIKIHSLDINIYNGDTTYFSGNSNFNNNQFSGNNGDSNSSNNESIDLHNNKIEQADIKSENNNKEDNNVNVLV